MSRRAAVTVVAAAVAVLVVAGMLAVLVWSRRDGTVARAPVGGESIVMLGDSITELADWGSLRPRSPLVNRGYAGYTTAQLVPVARAVASGRPRAALVLTGTNDIRDGRPPAWTVEHLAAIVDVFEQEAPGTVVVIQTILPRADARAEVVAANAAIVDLAAGRGLEVVDLYPAFDDGSGALRAGDTVDGVHLSEAGYRRWAATLAPVLERLEAPPGVTGAGPGS